MRSPRTATAVAAGIAGSIVITAPPTSTRSAPTVSIPRSAPPHAARARSSAAIARGARPEGLTTSGKRRSLEVREADREVHFDSATFETIPEVEPEEWQDDLADIEPEAGADRVLERGEVADVVERRAVVGEVVAAVIAAVAVEEGDVGGVEEREAAHGEAGDGEQRHRVLEVAGDLEVAAELLVLVAAQRGAAAAVLVLERQV